MDMNSVSEQDTSINTEIIAAESEADKNIKPITEGESKHPYGKLIDYEVGQELTIQTTGQKMSFDYWKEQPRIDCKNPGMMVKDEEGKPMIILLSEIKKTDEMLIVDIMTITDVNYLTARALFSEIKKQLSA